MSRVQGDRPMFNTCPEFVLKEWPTRIIGAAATRWYSLLKRVCRPVVPNRATTARAGFTVLEFVAYNVRTFEQRRATRLMSTEMPDRPCLWPGCCDGCTSQRKRGRRCKLRRAASVRPRNLGTAYGSAGPEPRN